MSSLAMRRAKERYVSKRRFPLGGRSDHGYKAGNVVVWVAGIGLLMILTVFWAITTIFWSG